MKKVFIKVQSSVGQSWADSIESINSYTEGVSTDTVETLKNERNFEQRVNVYTQIANQVKMTPDNGNFKIQIAVPRDGIEPRVIDMTEAFNTLTVQNGFYEAVHFGFIFGEDGRGKDYEVIQNSIFFARDPNTNRFVNAVTEEEITDKDYLEAAVWFTMYRVRGTHLYYMIVNPNLVSVPEDLGGKFEDVQYFHLNTRDGTFRSKVFAPSITGGKIVGNNIIVATADEVVIDTFGLSMLHYESGAPLDEDLPTTIEMLVESSAPYTREKNVINVDMAGKNVATLTYQWLTGTYLDSALTGEESLRYSFAIIKE